MAANLYGNIYYKDEFAGTLEQLTGGRFSFTYDIPYLSAGNPQIAHTLFRRFGPHYSDGLHPFFDNLIAEGWLARAQARALNIREDDRFARLLAFGLDCPGAVSVRDPHPLHEPNLDAGTSEEIAALATRASISGVQRKFFATRTKRGYAPAKRGDLSTHIAKLRSPELAHLVELEYLTTIAAKALLPDDEVVDVEIANIPGIDSECLLVQRFDRTPEKIHFEEFNQLLGRSAGAKYDGAYGEMADFIRKYQATRQEEDVFTLFCRILVCILVGNNDAHMKNFGLLYKPEGFRLAPFYDVVAAALYKEFSQGPPALRLGPKKNPSSLTAVDAKHLQTLAASFGLSGKALEDAVTDLKKRLSAADTAIDKAPHGGSREKQRLREFIGKRWNGTFNSIGK